MVPLVRRTLNGLKFSGPRWLARATPKNAWEQPRVAPVRGLRGLFIGLSDRLHHATTASVAWSDDTLQVFYDLAAAPVAWDFARVLASAEVERRARGLGGIGVVFVPGPHQGLRKEPRAQEVADDADQRLWRLRHVLVPMLALLPSVRGYAMCATREQAWSLISDGASHVWPADYRISVPRRPDPAALSELARRDVGVWPLLGASPQGRRLAETYLSRVAGGRRAIVITLRNAALSPARNSRIADWAAFADGLDPARYAPVFVHDGDPGLPAPPAVARHPVCEAASFDIELRMGLYEKAWLVMGIYDDPASLAWVNEKVRYVTFMPIAADGDTSPAGYAEAGLSIGLDTPFAKPWHQLVWREDTLAAIRPAFTAMEGRLEAIEALERVEAQNAAFAAG